MLLLQVQFVRSLSLVLFLWVSFSLRSKVGLVASGVGNVRKWEKPYEANAAFQHERPPWSCCLEVDRAELVSKCFSRLERAVTMEISMMVDREECGCYSLYVLVKRKTKRKIRFRRKSGMGVPPDEFSLSSFNIWRSPVHGSTSKGSASWYRQIEDTKFFHVLRSQI